MKALPIWDSVLHDHKPVLLFSGVIPHLIDHLNPATFLKLRQVCKSWKNDIEVFLEERNKDFHKSKICVKLQNRRKIVQICREIISCGVENPFPGGGLSIHMKTDNRHHVIPFLDKFGDKIQHLHLDLNEMPTLFLEMLKDCLERTSNLKGLYIQGVVLPEQIRYALLVRLPVLKGLEILQFKIFNNVAWKHGRSMIKQVLDFSERSINLKKFYLRFGNIENLGFMLPYCPNLSELELVLNSTVVDLKYSEIFHSPLKSLTLDIRYMEELEREHSLESILSIKERVAKSLEKLNVVVQPEYHGILRDLIDGHFLRFKDGLNKISFLEKF